MPRMAWAITLQKKYGNWTGSPLPLFPETTLNFRFLVPLKRPPEACNHGPPHQEFFLAGHNKQSTPWRERKWDATARLRKQARPPSAWGWGSNLLTLTCRWKQVAVRLAQRNINKRIFDCASGGNKWGGTDSLVGRPQRPPPLSPPSFETNCRLAKLFFRVLPECNGCVPCGSGPPVSETDGPPRSEQHAPHSFGGLPWGVPGAKLAPGTVKVPQPALQPSKTKTIFH